MYDPIGNRVTHERQYRDDQSQLVQLAIGYVANALNQYETAAVSGGAPGKSKYYHDADGNLTMMSLAGDMNCDGVVDFADLTLFIRAIKYFAGTETWPFTCPALNGDLNGDGTVTMADLTPFNAAITAGWTGPSAAYDWDSENRLVTARPIEGSEAAGMSRVDFRYDSSWRRVRKTVTPWDANTSNWASAPSLDRKYLWSGWRLLLEIDVPAGGPEDVIRKFTWGLDLAGQGGAVNSLESAGTIGGLLAVRKYDVSGAPEPDDPVDYVYLYDAMGNVGQVVDWSKPADQAAAAVVAHYEYDPYGGVTKAEGGYAADNVWRFSTKQWDDETGLGYWGYRYYSPGLGRWVSRDPIEEEGGIHLFGYAANRPNSAYDPLGTSYEDDWIVHQHNAGQGSGAGSSSFAAPPSRPTLTLNIDPVAWIGSFIGTHHATTVGIPITSPEILLAPLGPGAIYASIDGEFKVGPCCCNGQPARQFTLAATLKVFWRAGAHSDTSGFRSGRLPGQGKVGRNARAKEGLLGPCRKVKDHRHANMPAEIGIGVGGNLSPNACECSEGLAGRLSFFVRARATAVFQVEAMSKFEYAWPGGSSATAEWFAGAGTGFGASIDVGSEGQLEYKWFTF